MFTPKNAKLIKLLLKNKHITNTNKVTNTKVVKAIIIPSVIKILLNKTLLHPLAFKIPMTFVLSTTLSIIKFNKSPIEKKANIPDKI